MEICSMWVLERGTKRVCMPLAPVCLVVGKADGKFRFKQKIRLGQGVGLLTILLV